MEGSTPSLNHGTRSFHPTPSSLNRKGSGSKLSIPIQESFVMLSKSQVSPLLVAPQRGSKGGTAEEQQRGSLSHRLKTAGKMFDLISHVSQVDHPLCQDCADELIIKLEKRLSEVRKEKEAYEAYLATLVADEEAGGGRRVTEADVVKLKEQERNALDVLKDLEKEKAALKEELEVANRELEEVDTLKLNYWQEMNNLQDELQKYHNERDSVNLNYEYVSNQLEKLKKTNVYNDTFRIWHDGPFGTINGFRMGRLPNQPVDWSEINAAMGQALLLLDTMASKLNFTFTGYRLVPMGSFSRIEKTEGDKGVHELYGSGDLKGMLFWNRRFDNALVSFLNCLQQIGDYAEQRDPKFRLPYRSPRWVVSGSIWY
ncbi:hypothetical protein SpCBS45565_g01271 [Spizellomyces sp. 'palustris']|nr:hypothetical protein SpCBS45565_g01271 [Spizellomyces sp. 'palustris']